MDRDPENLDPNFAKQIIAETFSQAVFDSLITFSYEGDFIPLLASEFGFTSDNTLEFKLREGITFHNGEPFNAGIGDDLGGEDAGPRRGIASHQELPPASPRSRSSTTTT